MNVATNSDCVSLSLGLCGLFTFGVGSIEVSVPILDHFQLKSVWFKRACACLTTGLTDLEEMEFENSGGQFRSNSDQSGYETDQAAEVPIPGQQQQRLRLSPRATAGFRGHTSEMYSQLRRYTAPTASGSGEWAGGGDP